MDGTRELYPALADPRLSVHLHEVNRGKGAAIRTASRVATGDYLVVCDADLEYAPEEIPRLLQPVVDGEAEVVFGIRTFSSHTAYSFLYVLGNKGVTLAANLLFMPLTLYRELDIREAGFGMEAEITGKLLGRGIRPYEVSISYRARRRDEGKKLTWKDGVQALVILGRERWRAGRS